MSDSIPELDNMIEKIRQDSRAQAGQILSEAEQYAAQRRSIFETQKEKTLADAEKKGEEEALKIRNRQQSALNMERKRVQLKFRENLLKEAEQELFRSMEQLIGTAGYEETLIGWISEGIIAIDKDKAVVNASSDEKKLITPSLLKKAEKRIKEMTGRNVEISLNSEEPLPVQGVIVSTEDKRISYNNQVPVRYRRKEAVIRELLLNELIDPLLNSKESDHE